MNTNIPNSRPVLDSTPRKDSDASTSSESGGRVSACFFVILLSLAQSGASTLISGNISGTWTKTGSPYVVIDKCTVPSGQVLTIQPGVTVVIGENLVFDVFGQVLAIGTPAERITFRGPSATNRWTNMYLQHGGGGESQFKYCDFSDAWRALYLAAYRENATMRTVIANCTFSNCSDLGIYGDSEAYVTITWNVTYWHTSRYEPSLEPLIDNCRFRDSGNGCRFFIHGGTAWNYYTGSQYAYGKANPVIKNSAFESLAGTAISLEIGDYPGSSTAKVINSLVSSCSRGVATVDPYDSTVWNCIIQNCTTGVRRTGSLSSQVGYNCLFNNQTKFVGYPGVFGQIVMANNNGTPCDVAFNIFQNPLFVDPTNYYLSASSPCIDAGDASPAYNDCVLGSSFSLGTTVNDIGPYGGPGACGWLGSPSILVQPASQVSCLGQSASFAVQAAGAPPLGYQWWFNGTRLAGKTSASLVLSNLQKGNSGAYWVVVTNSMGSVTSSPPAQLVVNDACVDLHMYAGLNIAGQTGSTYVLSYTTDLGDTNSWQPLATNTMSSAGWFYLDMASPFSPQRFYKAVLKP